MSAWSGTRPGTRAGCRKRRASFSTCCELPFRPEAPTLRAKQFGKFNLLRFETGSENMMATARLRPQMMRLTDAAADRIKSVMANAGRPIVGVRVGVKNGGCAGMAYTMEYAEQVEPSDEVVEDKGVRVGVDYKDINVLDDPRVREGIKSYTNWPTIPQFYVKGEFVGGCDIVRAMFQSGELQELLNQKGVPTARRVAGAEILSMGGVLPPD